MTKQVTEIRTNQTVNWISKSRVLEDGSAEASPPKIENRESSPKKDEKREVTPKKQYATNE